MRIRATVPKVGEVKHRIDHRWGVPAYDAAHISRSNREKRIRQRCAQVGRRAGRDAIETIEKDSHRTRDVIAVTDPRFHRKLNKKKKKQKKQNEWIILPHLRGVDRLEFESRRSD